MNLENIIVNIRKLNLDEISDLSKKLLELDLDNVYIHLKDQSYTFFYFSMCMAKLNKDYRDILIDLNKIKFEIRKKEEESTQKKLTEKYLEAFVEAHPDVILQQKRVNDYDCQLEIFKGLVRALEQRRDMLVQMSSNKRAEIKLQ